VKQIDETLVLRHRSGESRVDENHRLRGTGVGRVETLAPGKVCDEIQGEISEFGFALR